MVLEILASDVGRVMRGCLWGERLRKMGWFGSRGGEVEMASLPAGERDT